jgi:ferredoxin
MADPDDGKDLTPEKAEDGHTRKTDDKLELKRKAALRRLRKPHVPSRRKFLFQGLAFLIGAIFLGWRRLVDRAKTVFIPAGTLPIRPPGALANEKDFLAACIHCGLCGTVCENGCIRFFGLGEKEHGPITPYLDVRLRSCTLCMRCNQICPSGALLPIDEDLQVLKKEVKMGIAEVDPELCISYLGRVCGYCHDACPLPNESIKLIPPATPKVIADGCVGCGRCVEFCPQTPTAIAVVRRPDEKAAGRAS